MINLSEVGARASATSPLSFQCGLYLPGIRASDGFRVLIRVIHQSDRFDPAIPTQDFALQWIAGSLLDLWQISVAINAVAGTHFGQPGLYLYRFQLWWDPPQGSSVLVTRWFTDPFARETDVGSLSAIQVPASTSFAWSDSEYRTPELDDLVVYELHVEQFNDTFAGVVDRFEYLQSLGVNCLELMPVTSPKLDFDWGYGPLNYFAPSAHFGGPGGLESLVDAAHSAGIAVILDVVYQHVDNSFPYAIVYRDLASVPGAPYVPSPMIGSDGGFGPICDFSRQFTQQFFQVCNQFLLDEYHIDGFRYDEVTDMYLGPTDTAYAMLAYESYMYSLSISRFQQSTNSYSRLIQCAESLGKTSEVLRQTYTNSAWTDDLLNQAEGVASGNSVTDAFAHSLDPYFGGKYPGTKTVVNLAGAPVDMPVAPFQYLNTHDHSYLSVFTGTTGNGDLSPGNRSNVWRLQPLVIALYTCQGIPMLWEGEEFNDDFQLPWWGSARVNLRRDIHWEYFYDEFGSPLIRLYRRLAKIRRQVPALRSRESYYYWQQSLQGTQALAYHRHKPADSAGLESYAMILLNFGTSACTLQVPFPKTGTWTEQVDADTRPPWTINVGQAGQMISVSIPSNYGCVFSN